MLDPCKDLLLWNTLSLAYCGHTMPSGHTRWVVFVPSNCFKKGSATFRVIQFQQCNGER